MRTRPKPTMQRRSASWVAQRLPEDLRALTIRQPWAWAVVAGLKCVENRTRPPPAAFVGQLIAVHAGVADFYEANLQKLARSARGRVPDEYACGYIVGFARLVGWTKGPRRLSPTQKRWYSPGSHAWLLDDVHLLKNPVAASGALGFWKVKGRARKKLMERIGR